MRYFIVAVPDDEGPYAEGDLQEVARNLPGGKVAEAHHVQQLVPGVHTFAAEIEVS